MEQHMTPAEVAGLLRIHVRKAYRLLHSGTLPGVFQVGREFRIDRAKLEAWVDAGGEMPARTAGRGGVIPPRPAGGEG